MNQSWRLPVELGLLSGMLYLLWKPAARAVAPRLVSGTARPLPLQAGDQGHQAITPSVPSFTPAPPTQQGGVP